METVTSVVGALVSLSLLLYIDHVTDSLLSTLAVTRYPPGEPPWVEQRKDSHGEGVLGHPHQGQGKQGLCCT